MNLKSGIALVGALIASAAVLGLFAGVGLGWPLFVAAIVAGLLSYIVAAVAARSTTSITAFGEFMRGWLIGMNAAFNAVIWVGLVGGGVGAAIGAVIGIFAFLSVFAPISQAEAYQGILGWLNWLMPMSWVIVGVGLVFLIVSAVLYGVTVGKVAYLKIDKADADWKTGTFFIKGGLISNLNPIDTAFNMGTFAFVDTKSGPMHTQHEAGHTLNLGAFGSVFHLVGALDENATSRGADALSERLAESNDTGTSGSNIPMWS
jgi:hypothetical protein